MKYDFSLFCESKNRQENEFSHKFNVLCEQINPQHFDEFWKEVFIPTFIENADQGIDGVIDALLNEAAPSPRDLEAYKAWRNQPSLWQQAKGAMGRGVSALGDMARKGVDALRNTPERVRQAIQGDPTEVGQTMASQDQFVPHRGTADWYQQHAQQVGLGKTQQIFNDYLSKFPQHAAKIAANLARGMNRQSDEFWTAKAIAELAPMFAKSAAQATANISPKSKLWRDIRVTKKQSQFDTDYKSAQSEYNPMSDPESAMFREPAAQPSSAAFSTRKGGEEDQKSGREAQYAQRIADLERTLSTEKLDSKQKAEVEGELVARKRELARLQDTGERHLPQFSDHAELRGWVFREWTSF
jgi:hypothetical protein